MSAPPPVTREPTTQEKIKALEAQMANWPANAELRLEKDIMDMYEEGRRRGEDELVLNTREVQMRESFDEKLQVQADLRGQKAELEALLREEIQTSAELTKAVTKLREKAFDGALTQLVMTGAAAFGIYYYFMQRPSS